MNKCVTGGRGEVGKRGGNGIRYRGRKIKKRVNPTEGKEEAYNEGKGNVNRATYIITAISMQSYRNWPGVREDIAMLVSVTLTRLS